MSITYTFTVTAQIYDKEHLYPNFKIAHIAEGAGTYRIGNVLYELSEGDIFFLNNLNSRKIVKIEKGPIVIDLYHFPPSEIKSRPKIVSAFYSTDFNYLKYSSEKLYGGILEMLKTVLKDPNKHRVSELLLDVFFSLLEDDLPDSLPSRMDTLAFMAANYIWDNYAQELYVTDIADHLNVSRKHLEKVFKSAHGVGVNEYIRLIRIHHVVLAMQEHPDRNVLDIAFSCGFTSSSGFYDAYKAIKGTAPKRKKQGIQ